MPYLKISDEKTAQIAVMSKLITKLFDEHIGVRSFDIPEPSKLALKLIKAVKFTLFDETKHRIVLNNTLIDFIDPDRYKGIGDSLEYYRKLTKILKDDYGAEEPNQAWRKMYEILHTYGEQFFSVVKSGADKYVTFHLCELPGAFIFAINQYLVNRDKPWDWHAQSLAPGKSNKAKDAFGNKFKLVTSKKDGYDFGPTQTGDITDLNNIIYYEKYCKHANLITADCGVSQDRRWLIEDKLSYAVLLFMALNVPVGGNFVIKLYLPPKTREIIVFTGYLRSQFTNLILYKPRQNVRSEEYYMIGINRHTEISTKDRNFLISAYENYETNYGKKEISYKFVGQNVWERDVERIFARMANEYIEQGELRVDYVNFYDLLSPNDKKEVQRRIEQMSTVWLKYYRPPVLPENKKIVKVNNRSTKK